MSENVEYQPSDKPSDRRCETERHLCGASSVLLMLPGALMTPAHMRQEGLFDAVREQRLALDVIAPNLHAEGADNRRALQSLERDWLTPLRAQYPRVWLGGISRGGQLALSSQIAGTSPVQGLCLLAPYAGGRITTNAIQRAGGVHTWVPDPADFSDPDVRLWHWLKAPDGLPPVFMGYGDQDRFADGMSLLSRHLPGAQVVKRAGAHDWACWLPLWRQFLDQGHFPALP